MPPPLRARITPCVIAILCPFLVSGSLRAQSPSPSQGPTAAVGLPSRDVSWGKLPGNFILDEKEIWLFPIQLAHGRHLVPTLLVLGTTTGLLFADAHDAPYFRRTSSFQTFNRGFSGPVAASEIALVPASFYLAGLIRDDSYSEKTALFAGEAVADSLALNLIMKIASRRLRPSDIPPTGNFSDTFFRGNASLINGSFPSAHAMAAFFRRRRFRRAISQPSLGSLGRLRSSRRHLFISDYAAVPFSVRRFPRRSSVLSHCAFRRAAGPLTCLRLDFAHSEFLH